MVGVKEVRCTKHDENVKNKMETVRDLKKELDRELIRYPRPETKRKRMGLYQKIDS